MLQAPLAFAQPDITDLEIDGVVSCLRSGWLTSGNVVREFELEFRDHVRALHAISTSSATTGSLLILDALRDDPHGHDGAAQAPEIIVPACTFSGPAMMAAKLGYQVVLADVDEDHNLDLASAERVRTVRTRIVMPTHFAGRSCDMVAIVPWAKRHRIDVVDDAAHAFPTVDQHLRLVGHQGARATFFSFYATKTLTTGEGGMVVTEDDGLATRIRSLRSHGFSREAFDRYTNPQASWRYDVSDAGWKANMTDLAAAIGSAQLKRTAEMLHKREAIAEFYQGALEDLARQGKLIRPRMDIGHAWHLYVLRLRRGDRDQFIEQMRLRGVQCSVHFIPLYRHSWWQQHLGLAAQPRLFPKAEKLFRESVSLPIYSRMTRDDCERVVDAVRWALPRC